LILCFYRDNAGFIFSDEVKIIVFNYVLQASTICVTDINAVQKIKRLLLGYRIIKN